MSCFALVTSPPVQHPLEVQVDAVVLLALIVADPQDKSPLGILLQLLGVCGLLQDGRRVDVRHNVGGGHMQEPLQLCDLRPKRVG